MLDLEPGAVPELHRLARQGEGAGDHRLRGDDGRGGRKGDQRVQGPARSQMVEGVLGRGWIPQQQRALPEIVEQEARERDAEPRDLDRTMAEVAEVRVQRFATCHHQEHRTQHDEAPARGFCKKADGVVGRHGGQHRRLVHDLAQPEDPERGKPDEHYGTE